LKKNIFITRAYQFSAAHRLFNPALNEIENKIIYNKCNNIRGHGHDYSLEVTLTGYPHPKTGMIISLIEFDYKINSLLKKIDYKHLNFELPFFKTNISSGEYIIRFLWRNLIKLFPKNMLFHLKLWETKNNYFEYGYHF
jgi:6-pyruvoyltetrahydropterin/6-carboxytetrahydropterin synthase